jgi:hypothetical protein
MKWQELEKEIVKILHGHHVVIVLEKGETWVELEPFDYLVRFNVSEFAKQLARRLEAHYA